MRNSILFWLPAFVWASVIFTLSGMSFPGVSELGFWSVVFAKTVHIVEYGILFLLLYRAFMNTTSYSRKTAAIISLALVGVYGGSDEFHQSFTPGRNPSVLDVVIDVIGAGIVWFILWKLLPKMPKRLIASAKKLGLI